MSRNDILSYETMRHVALEIVQLGRDVPEDQWFEDATHYAASLIRRLCEEAYDAGRQGELSSLGEAARDENLIMKHKTVVDLDGRNTEAWIQPDEYVPGWWTMVYWDWRQNITHVIVRRTEAEAKAELDKFVAQHGRAREGQNSAW